MRIGELLLMQEVVDAWVLTQTLKDHAAPAGSRQRLVSLLISRAQLDADDGALALSQQLGYPAALQRHLERRDPACERLIPVELVRRWVVLPLGRARDGRLVVVARDPTPILSAALEHASKQSILLAVTPGLHLERLIRSIYGAPIETIPEAAPSIGDIGDVETASPPDPQREAVRGRTVSAIFSDGTPELLPNNPYGTDRVDTTLGHIDNAVTIAAAERIAFAYASRRWEAALLLAITGDVAVGRRGNGSRIAMTVDTIELPLATPSILQVALESGQATAQTPASLVQQRIDHLLEDAQTPVAAPIVVAGHTTGAIVAGDPLYGSARESLADLARLADALSAAHERFARRR
jgi:hypothetical protein